MKKKYGYKQNINLKKNQRFSKKSAWSFWKNTQNNTEYDKIDNSPLSYTVGKKKSKYLVSLIKKYISKKSKILEIGCNVGRNLNELHLNSFKNLHGVEINSDAIKLMKKIYPGLYKKIKINIGPIEREIKKFENNKFDLIYTMAVLEHIHWDSEFIFKIMKKISSHFIITIEDESTAWSNRHFPRNYKIIFEDKNWKQIYKKNCKHLKILDDRFNVRVFKKVNSK